MTIYAEMRFFDKMYSTAFILMASLALIIGVGIMVNNVEGSLNTNSSNTNQPSQNNISLPHHSCRGKHLDRLLHNTTGRAL